MRVISTIAAWLDSRLQLGAPLKETMEHPVPRASAQLGVCSGSAALTVFAVQVATGMLLALVYVRRQATRGTTYRS